MTITPPEASTSKPRRQSCIPQQDPNTYMLDSLFSLVDALDIIKSSGSAPTYSITVPSK